MLECKFGAAEPRSCDAMTVRACAYSSEHRLMRTCTWHPNTQKHKCLQVHPYLQLQLAGQFCFLLCVYIEFPF